MPVQLSLLDQPRPAIPANPRFDGPCYSPEHDDARLTGQLQRIFAYMKSGDWHTLSEIAAATGAPEASASANLRHLKKSRFGSHGVEKRPRGERAVGLWEYRLIVNTK